MFLGAGEIVVVLAVALMVLGPKKMPEVARNLARFVAQLRRMADDVRSQVDDALQDTPPKPQPRHQPTLPASDAVYDVPTHSGAHVATDDGKLPEPSGPAKQDHDAAADGVNPPGTQAPKVS